MAETIAASCPSCKKQLKVPADFVGKLIRCKECSAMFEVQDPRAKGKPVPAKPVAAKPVAAKPAPPAADAPIPFKPDDAPAKKPFDDDDDGPMNYGVIKEGEEARCPFCAKPLESEDAAICLHCGFDMKGRKRHETKAVYELTAGDYFMYWLPAIAWSIFLIVSWVLIIILWFKVNSLIGEYLETGEKDPATQKPAYYVKPWCCPLWTSIIFAFITATGLRVIYKRFIKNPRPEEQKIKRNE